MNRKDFNTIPYLLTDPHSHLRIQCPSQNHTIHHKFLLVWTIHLIRTDSGARPPHMVPHTQMPHSITSTGGLFCLHPARSAKCKRAGQHGRRKTVQCLFLLVSKNPERYKSMNNKYSVIWYSLYNIHEKGTAWYVPELYHFNERLHIFTMLQHNNLFMAMCESSYSLYNTPWHWLFTTL